MRYNRPTVERRDVVTGLMHIISRQISVSSKS